MTMTYKEEKGITAICLITGIKKVNLYYDTILAKNYRVHI